MNGKMLLVLTITVVTIVLVALISVLVIVIRQKRSQDNPEDFMRFRQPTPDEIEVVQKLISQRKRLLKILPFVLAGFILLLIVTTCVFMRIGDDITGLLYASGILLIFGITVYAFYAASIKRRIKDIQNANFTVFDGTVADMKKAYLDRKIAYLLVVRYNGGYVTPILTNADLYAGASVGDECLVVKYERGSILGNDKCRSRLIEAVPV